MYTQGRSSVIIRKELEEYIFGCFESANAAEKKKIQARKTSFKN